MKKIVLLSLFGMFLLMLFLMGCNSDGINYEIEKNDLYGNMVLKLNEGYVNSVIVSLNYAEIENIVKLYQYYTYDKNYFTYDRDFTSASLKQFRMSDCDDAPVKAKIKATGDSFAVSQNIYPRSSCLFHQKLSEIFLKKENCFFETGSNLTFDEKFYSKRLIFLCQTQKAVYGKDINLCDGLELTGKENTVQECYFELGQIYADASVCNMIDTKLENSRVRCYGFLGANLKDDSVCDNLDIERNIEDCRGVVSDLA